MSEPIEKMRKRSFEAERRVAACGAAMIFLAGGALWAQASICDQPSPIPCTDPRGCPDLLVSQADLAASWFVENRRFNRRNCSVLEGEVLAGVRTLIRFASVTPNIGPGDLIVGNPFDHPEWFDLETCHRHQHFKDYADYRLWTPVGYAEWQALVAANPGACSGDLLAQIPDLATKMVAGRKQGFCVVDLLPWEEPPCPSPNTLPFRYGSCLDQGISVCWADVYVPEEVGQWIDVTDLPDGDYVLEIEVNAERLFTEASYTNNSAKVDINLVKPPRRGRPTP